MIIYVNGDLFTSPAQVLVNTVNTVGVMGKGIAYDFKRIYPAMFETYRTYCDTRRLTIGKLYLHRTSHKWVLNFPTKSHWRYPSRPQYIDRGLRTFRNTYLDMGIRSIAFPALGCGNGGLDYDSQVRPLMDEYLSSLSIPVFVYVPRPAAGLPEHRDAKQIARWLRSTPATLPFDEVWHDLEGILARTSEFATIATGSCYKAEIECTTHGDPLLCITTRSRKYRYNRDLLLDFWQQLRDYGFVHRSIVPRYHRVSYLFPIFERLPYVARVTMSDSLQGLDTRPAAALQVIPPSLPEHGIFSPTEYEMAEV